MSSTLGVAKWLPSDRSKILKWARKRLANYKGKNPERYAAFKKYFPDAQTADEELQEFVRNASLIKVIVDKMAFSDSIKELIYAIGTEADVGQLVIEMFRQQDHPEALGPADMILLLSDTIRTTPDYVDNESDIQIPCPVGALLTYAMVTPAGYAAFLKRRVNELFRNILNDYQKNWLLTSNSVDKLADVENGWFTPLALSEMPNFDDDFVCDPNAPHKGFKSFDDFFTRDLKKGARPVGGEDDPNVVVNACENAPYGVTYVVQKYDAYWIKSQPYSVAYILDNDPLMEKFIGGTIYQGFLSPHTYHQFHAPVSGKVVVSRLVSGTYFSQPYYTDNSANYIAAQPYLAHVSTRGVIIIDTETALGLVAFVPIGMVDVSTVDLKIQPNQYIKKGENIGTFHFGGSSHVILFEKGKELAFDLQGIKPDPLGNSFLKVNTKLATFVPPKQGKK